MFSYIPVILHIGPGPEIDHHDKDIVTINLVKAKKTHRFCRRMVDIHKDWLLRRCCTPSDTDFVYTIPMDSFDLKWLLCRICTYAFVFQTFWLVHLSRLH